MTRRQKLPGLDANTKSRMKELQKKAKQSLNGTPSHIIYSAKSLIRISYIEMESYHKRKSY